MKSATPIEISNSEYVDRLRLVQEIFKGLSYKSIYEFEYGKLEDDQVTSLRNFWAFRNNDVEILIKFESLAKQIKNK